MSAKCAVLAQRRGGDGPLSSLLPETVRSRECFGDVIGELHPLEGAVVANALPSRQAEFTSVRVCAREALSALGVVPGPILPGPTREPLWPDGVVGSMTHCAGYRAAAVGRAEDVSAIGIDAEPHGPLPPDVCTLVTLPDEARRLAELRLIEPAVHWDRLLFSAKESLFKAWYPRTRQWLEFSDASVEISPRGTFRAVIVAKPATDEGHEADLIGRWCLSGGLLITSIVMS